jgi:hypothetical protein
MESPNRFLILDDRTGKEIRQKSFEAPERVRVESFMEAKHRLNNLVTAKCIKPWQATIVRVDGDQLIPEHW